MVFWGEARDQHIHEHAHESPAMMTRPLWVLAALAVVGGVLNLPSLLTMEQYLEPAVGAPAFHPSFPFEMVLLIVSALVAVAGAGLAYGRYVKGSATGAGRFAAGITRVFSPLEPIARNKWYVDELYATFIVSPLLNLANWFSEVVDHGVVDGAVNLVGQANLAVGGALRKVHNGLVPTYALSLFCGVVALLLWLVIGG